jgi:hypothetical protein
MASNTVKSVAVVESAPSVSQPSKAPDSSGRSAVSFGFYGVYTNGSDQTVVVLRAGSNRSNECSVNDNSNGGIFPGGDVGVYCELTTDTNDLNNWTVMASGPEDEEGTGITFVAGTGGGGH